jgi:hypothetical protein
MAEIWRDAVDKLGTLAGKWTGYAAFATFLLYLFGYLTLRFQLMAYGVVTDLDAFDEKYWFAGCSFVVNFLLAVLYVLFALGFLGLIVFLFSRPIPRRYRGYVGARVRSVLNHSLGLLIVGCVAALLLIQGALRQCLLLHNLLLADQLPDTWISRILQAGESSQEWYFVGIVAGLVLTVAMLGAGVRRRSPTAVVSGAQRLCAGLLAILIASEFLLLPINFGMLINSRQLPRVEQISTTETLPDGTVAWLLWETKDALTYFLLGRGRHRSLVTLPHKDYRIVIVGNDAIFKVIFPDDPPGLPAR